MTDHNISTRTGSATNLQTSLGQWNEKTLLPVGWIFSLWLLATRKGSKCQADSLCFEPQNSALQHARKLDLPTQKKLTDIVSDFAVHCATTPRTFVSAEIKYSTRNGKQRLNDALRSQFRQVVDRPAPPGRSARHTLIFITSPSINSDESIDAASTQLRRNSLLEQLGFKPKREWRLLSVPTHEVHGCLFQYHKTVGESSDEEQDCWVWWVHPVAITYMLTQIVLGEEASTGAVSDTAEHVLQPLLTRIDQSLLPWFGALTSTKSLPLRQQLISILGQPVDSLAALDELFRTPLQVLTRWYVGSCIRTRNGLEPEECAPWERLLRKLISRLAPRGYETTGTSTHLNIKPMQLEVAGEKQDAEPLASVLKAVPAYSLLIVEGQSGSGKSTVFEELHHEWLSSIQPADFANKPELPLLLRLSTLSPSETQELRTHQGLVAALEVPPYALAILKIFPVCLFVDAYDQLLVNGSALAEFIQLAERLKEQGFQFSKIVVSSRPQFGADRVMLQWAGTAFAPHMVSPKAVVLRPPSDGERKRFINECLCICLRSEDTTPQTGTRDRDFETWVQRLFGREYALGGPAPTSREITQTPLLLTLALYVYLARQDMVADIQTVADLFNAVISACGENRDSLGISRGTGWSQTLQDLSELCWNQIATAANTRGILSFFNVAAVPSAATAAPSWSTSAGTAHKASNDILKYSDLPFLVVRTEHQRVEFVHPSFHEFLAARWMVEKFFEADSLPRIQPIPADNRSSELDRLSDFAKSCLRPGREGFRYLLGWLYRRARSASPRDWKKVEQFFSLMAEETCLQQYLYDAGFLDEAVTELQLLDESVTTRFRPDRAAVPGIVLGKLNAHVLYGYQDQRWQRLAIDCFQKIAEEVSCPPWYRLFCLDHAWNRLKREETSSPGVKRDVERLVAQIETLEAEQGLQANNWAGISIRTTALCVALRFGHFYGHMGNHTIGAQGPGFWQQGVDYFTRAILYRVVDARLSFGVDFYRDHRENLQELEGNPWFRDWIKSPVDKINGFEGFVGKRQAIADVAQQFNARAHLYFNLFVQNPIPCFLSQAAADCQRSEKLWQFAVTAGDNAEVTGTIKYYVYKVSLGIRFAMVTDWSSGDLGKSERYLSRLDEELREAEALIGFHYQESRRLVKQIEKWWYELSALP
jgi:hypothetical protein